MTGLIVLTFIPFVVAAGFLIRLRAEQKRVRRLEKAIDRSLHAERSAILAHELRSPAAAILGYQELIEDGTFGELPPRMDDAIQRIRAAADQMVALLDAIDRHDADPAEPETTSARDLIAGVVHGLRFEAEGRHTTVSPDDTDAALRTSVREARRALLLALSAAIKVSPRAHLRIEAREGDPPVIAIAGADLAPHHPDTAETGAALRLRLARDCARAARGTLDLQPDGTLLLTLPRLD